MVRFNWSALNDIEFEELCKELMKRKGFQNVKRMSGPGGGDRGLDIYAEEALAFLTGSTVYFKILVQCKNYWGSRTTIGSDEVENLANRARTLKYDRVLIITSHDLSSQGKITAEDITNNPEWGVRVEWWTEYDLIKFVFDYPDIRLRFSLKSATPLVMKIGILNGYTSNLTTEKPCKTYPTGASPDDWLQLLKGKEVEISFISANEINTSFDAILNPFGEIYPEEDPDSKKTYRRIINYIVNGGLFINTAGFPFFYYWNAIEGQSHTAVPSSILINRETRQVVGFYNFFSETLLYRDFKVTLDPGIAREVPIFQEPEDRRYVGNLLTLGINKVIQFRSVTSTINVTPLLRSEEGKLFPIAVTKYENGHLMIAGLELRSTEAPLVAQAVKNWLKTAGGQLPLIN